MTLLTYVSVYVGLFIFFAACVARAIRYARMPLHLRWELYPVPHEAPARSAHGGSSFEVADSHREPRRPNRLGSWKAMIPEMLFMRGLWRINRRLWFRSFPFHVGLYLIIGSIVLLVLAAAISLVVSGAAAHTTSRVFRGLYVASGAAGGVLAFAGALSLLARRLANPDLRPYTTAGDIFNLAFFLVTLGVLAAGLLVPGVAGPGALAVSRGLLQFDTGVRIPGLLAVGLMLGAALVAYIPLTHMSHFIAKYLTYHAVRWDDRPSLGDGRLEKAIAENLARRPTWAAAHMAADGTRTWTDVAAATPAGDRRS